jgi:hypothetical protein
MPKLIGGKARLMSVLGWEDLDPEEDARRARAREAYAKMYPLSTDDPYGERGWSEPKPLPVLSGHATE